jgi:16S rRNA (uracil1498-N3)-methyltransferase
LFVGPEGSFEAEEVACARQAGAHIVTLGPRVLRAETASVVLAALSLYELEVR